MARINHYSGVDVIQNLFTDAKNRGIMHLHMDEGYACGRHIKINHKQLLNFGTCGYMGLELDQRLKDGASEFAQKYGVQYSLSRTYGTPEINLELEELVGKIYNKPVIIYPSTTLGHISLIPILVSSEDAVILDQQAHISVQTGAQLLRQKGTEIDMIRHSSMEMLERKLKEYDNKYQKIWYMIDGVYSMYGDVAPMKEIIALMEKYPRLHVYIDDAHGMSWAGKNGSGYIYNEIGSHDRIILLTTMAKGFGAIGGIAVFPNEEMKWKVQVWGGPLSYSHPLAPPMIGAAIASAKIHLSDEITSMQKELQEKVNYCNLLLNKYELPVVSNPNTPIKFVGAGQPDTGYKVIKGVMDDGFFINTAIFPAVSVKCTGLRFTVTRHQELEDIEKLVESINKNYRKVLKEENISDDKVRKAFNLPVIETHVETKKNETIDFIDSITKINKDEWNSIYAGKGTYDWDGLKYMEECFSNNEKPEENWNFYYYIKKNKNGKIIIASFFIVGIFKDDILALEEVSQKIELTRKKDPYYLTSRTISMGSLLSEGEHLYIDKSNENWKNNFSEMLNKVDLLKQKENAKAIMLRDFDTNDLEINSLMIEKGFIKIEMPISNIINIKGINIEEHINKLSKKNRYNIRKYALKHENNYAITFVDNITNNELERYYELYKNVFSKNFALNLFPYPLKIFKNINNFNQWEILNIRNSEGVLVCFGTCYKSDKNYIPMVIGIDYKNNENIYRVAILNVIKRAIELKMECVTLGMSADIEKKKFGAIQNKICAYYQTDDNYNMEVISSINI